MNWPVSIEFFQHATLLFVNTVVQNRAAVRRRAAAVSLANLVSDFNAENKTLERGLDQSPLTEDEVVTAIQHSQWKPGEHHRSEREFAVFKSVAESRKLPKEAYFTAWTRENPSTFVVHHVWSITLYLPSIDGDGFDGYPIRDSKLRRGEDRPHGRFLGGANRIRID